MKGDVSEPPTIVGVVGIGHVPGIIRCWPKDQRPFIPGILEIPPPSLTSRIIKLSFRISILGVGGYLVYRYIPIPRMLKENAQFFAQKLMTNLKPKADFKYVVN